MSGPAIIVHGGCGRVDEASIKARGEGAKEAAEAGWKILRAGGSALDAVEAAVVSLEDNSLFNAGRGSVLNRDGRVEMDASIMNGATHAAGAVAGVTGILNPICLARRVMEASPHVMLIGAGAEEFARAQGIPQCREDELIADYRREEWEAEHGTVGAVACDADRKLAAGTSTGGMKGKLPGRVGDSPIIGAGTYADSGLAISCTGHGEHIMRMTLARLAAFLYQKSGNPEKAAEEALRQLEQEIGGEVGLIVVDRNGVPAFRKNSRHMPVCAISAAGSLIQC
ncbi:MAG TPA: isoaspartyl peptidase/L-asparaginase [Verrucomicrobiae bacterium]|nr:isoaspartyl peptidase/L-asparaginase [Verrucomicrobiae bacterium]